MTQIPLPPRRAGAGLLPASCVASLLAACLSFPVLAAPAPITLADGTGVRLLERPGPDGAPAPHYELTTPDGRTIAPRPAEPLLFLGEAPFDPVLSAGVSGDPRLAAPGDGRLVLVQFRTQGLPGYLDAIRALGAETHQHVPGHARLVRLPETGADAVLEQLRALPFVRWVGPFEPAWRLETAVARDLDALEAEAAPRRWNVRLVAPERERGLVARFVEDLGGTVDRRFAGALYLEATLTPAQLYAVLRHDGVLHVDRWSPFETDMDVVRQISGADFIEGIAGYTGTGVRGEVMDAGFNMTHVDFQSRPLIAHTTPGNDSHGAATSGIIFGDGTGQANKRGMLPDGQGIVANYNEGVFEGPSRYQHSAELVQSPYEAVFQSNSFGSARTTAYTNISAEMDEIIFDLDLSIMQSQSNAGNQDSRPQAWAKNIVSVGGVRHQGTLTKADDNWGGGASIGPAADGRIKPDLTHFYDSTGTTTTGGPTAYTESFGGTSGATPIVAGHFGIFFEMWADGAFGNPVDPVFGVFFNRPSQATAKAVMINSAVPYDWTAGGANGDLTRVRQGWGMPDLQSLWERRETMFVVDESDPLANLATSVHLVSVAPGTPDLRVTLTWADPPGVSGSLLHRINDLDLKVTSPAGAVYRGNGGLGSGLWSVPGAARDGVNTVENVFVDAPKPGTWTIEITAFELNEDGRPETPDLDADYALVASGVEVIPPPLRVTLGETLPAELLPGTPLEIRAVVEPGQEQVVPGSVEARYRTGDDAPFASVTLARVGSTTLYRGFLPGFACGDEPEVYLRALGTGGTEVTAPPGAPADLYGFELGETLTLLVEDFEATGGWTVQNVDLLDGGWTRGVPVGGGDRGDPPTDGDGSGAAWLTDNVDGNSDVDGGPTILTSPMLDLAGAIDPIVSYLRWFTRDDLEGADALVVELSGDGGPWTLAETVDGSAGAWIDASVRVADVLGAVPATLRLRVSATDNPNNSVVEAGFDGLRITDFRCEVASVPGDVDGDGVVDFADVLALLAAWGPCESDCAADLDGSGEVGFPDLLEVLAAFD